MIVVMKQGASPEQIEHMIQRVEELGLKAHPIYGTERTVIAAIGDKRDEHRQSLESGPGVAEVVPILAPYKVASLEVKPERTVVRVGPLSVGNCHLGIIAGPCAVESMEQTLATARAVKAAGATALRGGAFKPRTSPYSFQGLKEEGLKILAAAREETGLPVVTEVMSVEDVPLVADYADVLQIGARNMQNYRLLEEVGASQKPVLLKRGPAASMDELLLAAEYVLNAGNQNVMLCERGIRTFEAHTRYTLPLASVPYLHDRTHLPIVVDPSHGTGHTQLVARMAAAAVAAGADGLMLEVHPNPEKALSDGYQTLTFQQFTDTMQLVRRVAEAVGKQIEWVEADHQPHAGHLSGG
jgi:3-deoxy-7-phosphoheptulonate synthase